MLQALSRVFPSVSRSLHCAAQFMSSRNLVVVKMYGLPWHLCSFMGSSASVCDVLVMCFEDLVRGSISLDFSLPLQGDLEVWRGFEIPALRIRQFMCEMGGGYKLCPMYPTTYIPTIFFYSQLNSVNSKPYTLVHEIVRVRNCEIQANH